MRYASPLALPRSPVRGQHRRPARRHLRREPYATTHLFTHGLAGLIVLGILVMVGVLIVADDRRASTRLASAEIDARIASREADPAPLTEAEVFPGGSAAFEVTSTDLTADCSLAAGGALRTTLLRYGCTQAVRAALEVPYADYRITAGMLNLPDTASATSVGDQVRYLVETGDGGFTDMAGVLTGPGTPTLWRIRGHYVMYCVITGPAGELVPADAPAVQQLTRDVLDTHLHDTVLIRRAQ
jgi:Tfp pilus assembly protein PilX